MIPCTNDGVCRLVLKADLVWESFCLPRGGALVRARLCQTLRNLAYFNCLSVYTTVVTLFLSKVYYKVAPPSKRKELDISLLSSASESEIVTNAPKDLGRPR